VDVTPLAWTSGEAVDVFDSGGAPVASGRLTMDLDARGAQLLRREGTP
jgi:hypothetical protein